MIYRHSFNGILIGTYTRPTQRCRFKCPWVILSDLAKYSMTRSDLSATAELLVNTWCIVRDQEYWPSETSPGRLLVHNQLLTSGPNDRYWSLSFRVDTWLSIVCINYAMSACCKLYFCIFFLFLFLLPFVVAFILCHDFAFKMSPVMF